MRRVGVDVLVVGAGVLGRSIAFALASAEPGLRVALSGRRGAGASEAAGAMLGVLGEVTASGLRTRHGELRVRMAVEAAARWPDWRTRVHHHTHHRAGTSSRARDGYGTGTFMLLNAVSARLDERTFTAVPEAGRRYGLPVEEIDPGDVPAYRPLENDRALRALHLPQEAFLDARRWLAALDRALAALANIVRTPAGELSAAAAGYALHSRAAVFTAPRAVVAAGAWSTPLLEALDPDLTVCPVVATRGTSVTLAAPTPLPAVLRTPNRAYACGLHAVPQADGSWYVGASAAPALRPGAAPTSGALRFLLDAALGQLHHGLTGMELRRLHHGNRPIGVDGHPLLGATSRPGLWVATGTHRDGLHASPLIAEELAGEIVDGRRSPWLAPWQPERDPIADWSLEAAVEEAAAQHEALAAESRMRPPLTGDWPAALAELYRQRMARIYAQLPEGFVLPPELAPLGYEHGPELVKLIGGHLDRRRRAAGVATPRADRGVQWAGDDQQWWDWYMSLAADPEAEPATLTPMPALPAAAKASEREVAAALAAPYPLAPGAVAFYRRHGYLRLPGVIPPAVVATLAERADALLDAAHGPDNPGRFLALEQLWLTDPLLRSVALSRRLGDLAACLLGVEAVRLYHDNILSKEPGCGRTPWHRDSDHYPLDSAAVCTSWIPLHDIPAAMGPLACLSRDAEPDVLSATPTSPQDRSYDRLVAAELHAAGAVPDASPFTVGEVSFHATDCFHTAGPNLTTAPRRVLSSTYYADGTRLVPEPTAMSGTWTDFVPDTEPGGVAASRLNPVVGTSSHS